MRDDELSRKLNRIVTKTRRPAEASPPARTELRQQKGAKELLDRLHVIIEEIRRLDKEHPIPDETHPHIPPLLEEGRAIQLKLDPIIREHYRDNPAALAEWDEIMHMCDDLDEEDANKQDSPPAKKK